MIWPAPSDSGQSRQIFFEGPGGIRVEAHEYIPGSDAAKNANEGAQPAAK